MSAREGLIYGSWMAGIVVFYTIGGMFGLPKIANLIFGVLLGGGFSLLIERLYFAKKDEEKRILDDRESNPDPDNPYREAMDRDTVSCSNPNCSWQGKTGIHVYCPKCDERLY